MLWTTFILNFYRRTMTLQTDKVRAINLALSTSPYCHLSTYGVSTQYLEGSGSYTLEKIYDENFWKGNNSVNRQGRVMNLASAFLLLFTHEISNPYLEHSWSYVLDKIYTKKGINLQTDNWDTWNLYFALLLLAIYLPIKFQDNILQGYGNKLQTKAFLMGGQIYRWRPFPHCPVLFWWGFNMTRY